MALFGSKKQAKTDTPVDQVVSMRGQGIDNNRIIQTLQRDGYSSSQIFEAMNQADIKSTHPQEGSAPVTQAAEQPMDNSQTSTYSDTAVAQESMPPTTEQPVAQEEPVYSEPNYSQSGFRRPQVAPQEIPAFHNNSAEVEEMVEAIIEEKWGEIVKDISKIVEWKAQAEANMKSLEQEFSNMKEEFDKLHQAVIGKIGEYDKNILNVGAEIKAMEKVFSKVLPVFTEKVNDLSRVADELSNKKKK